MLLGLLGWLFVARWDRYVAEVEDGGSDLLSDRLRLWELLGRGVEGCSWIRKVKDAAETKERSSSVGVFPAGVARVENSCF